MSRGSPKNVVSLFQRCVPTVAQVLTRKKGDTNIRRHAQSVESPSVTGPIDFVWQSKPPSVWQAAVKNVGKNTLRVQVNTRDVWLASQQSHRERFACAHGIRTD
jgi:hypothetical protein